MTPAPRARTRALVLAAGLALLAGCMPAHRAAPPAAQVTAPEHWLSLPPGPATAMQAQWWRGFGDAELDRLVDAALAHNISLQATASRVAAARAQLDLAGAARSPALAAVVGGQVEHTLTDVGIYTTRAVQPELRATWEADLWGRLDQQARTAQALLRASQADRDAVALTVAASTVQAYIGLLALEAQLEQTRGTATSRAEALRLAEDKVRVGYASQLQLTQAQSEFEAVQQAVPQLELAIVRQHNALRLLTGELPGERLASARFDALQLPDAPTLLPAELLRRRPDLAQAEAQLAAADANLAARRAAFLPQVSLSVSAGKLFINALNYDPIAVWSVGGSILAPLFDAGRLRAQFDTASAQRDQAAWAYRGAALNAFSEVENGLAGVGRLAEQMDRVTHRRDILARSLTHARERVEAGYAPYLEQLDAQRSLYQTQIEAITVRQNQLLNTVALARALGGGWQADAAGR